MASSDRHRGKRTPSRDGSSSSREDSTPHSAPRRLASVVHGNTTTPQATTPRNYAAASRRLSARRSPAITATPHGIRALQRRQSIYTPGRDRRRSGRVQRETPLDILRNLGKVLAPTTRPISSSPLDEVEAAEAAESQHGGTDDLDDSSPDIPRPRLSLPIEPQDDESPPAPPPRLSLLVEEDDVTQRSIEMPRRDRTAREMAILPGRRSLTSTRFSDHFGDLSRMDDTEGIDVTISQPQDVDEGEGEDHIDTTLGQPIFDAGGETDDLRRFNLDFSFPTPDGPGEPPPLDGPGDAFEDFQLEAIEPADDGASVLSGVSNGGGVGFEVVMDDATSSAARGSSHTPPPLDEAQNGQRRANKKLSRHGVPVPSLPSGIVKKMATRFARAGHRGNMKITRDTLVAIEQATDWFFEQTSDDLTMYSRHAGRKTIDESDVIALMRRQRHLGSKSSVFALAQKHLPKELLQDIRLPRR